MTTGEFQDQLALRARAAGVTLADPLGERLEVYFRLLERWNEKINLTALPLSTPTDEALDRLLIEPIAAAVHIPSSARSLIDIGSGGGSPAIPLVLAAPRLHLRMVESRTRKSVFLKEAVRTLGIEAAVETARFEELLSGPGNEETSDLLSIRAVRIATDVLSLLQRFVRPAGQVFLFRSDEDSLTTLPPSLASAATHRLTSRGQLVVLTKR